MTRTGVPTAVRRLIAERIESVQQLEILLLLRAAPGKAWTARQVARALVTQVEPSEEWLAEMTRTQLLVSDGRVYRYAPATAELEAPSTGSRRATRSTGWRWSPSSSPSRASG